MPAVARPFLPIVLVSALLVPAAAEAATPPAPSPTFSVVARNLNNPRGLAAGPDGAIYVAEAGRAGKTCDKNKNCAGATSSITRILRGKATRVVRGLPSFAGADGTFATGAHGIAIGSDGTRYIANAGTLLCASRRPIAPALRPFVGHVSIARPSTTVSKPGADLQAYECGKNPDKTDRNANPYAILALRGHQYVVDAGANAILDVRGRKISVVATIPSRKVTDGLQQPVPTSIAKGPDGAFYVGTLDEAAGNGNARVWRVVPGEKPTVYRDGFTAITGLAFDDAGNLYVTEFTTDWHEENAPSGAVAWVSADGSQRKQLGQGTLFFPTGALIRDDVLYVSNWSTITGTAAKSGPFKGLTGQVVRTSPLGVS